MMARILLTLSAALLVFSVSAPANAAKYELIFEQDQLLIKGKRAIQKGRLEQAAYFYEEALRRNNLSDPDMIELRSDLCVTYMYLDRFEEAIEQCRLGIQLMPNRWETHNNLGTVFLVQGDFENAIETYEKALRMKPDSRILKFNYDIATQREAEFKAMNINRTRRDPLEDNPDDYGSSSSSAGF